MNANKLTFAALIILGCGPIPLIQPQPCGAGHVEASLSSVTLANDCGGGAAEAKDAAAPGACLAESPCPSLCRQSSMQLAFASSSLSDTNIEIRAVRLIEPSTKKVLQTLSSRSPQQWSGDAYIFWNEILPAGQGLKATYKLSAPSYHWASDARFGLQKFIVEVDVAIDGEVRTLQGEATREPEVAT